MAFQDFLAAVLNPNGVWDLGGTENRNRLAQAGIVPHDSQGQPMTDSWQRFGPQLSQPQASPVAAPQQAVAAAPAAPPSSGGGNGGGGLGQFISGLFQDPKEKSRNQTVDWLVKQGEDPGRAALIAANPATLQRYLLDKTAPADPKDALQMEKLGLEVQNMRNPGRRTTTINGKLVDADTGQVIGDYGDNADYHVLSPQEVEAAGLPPGTYQRSPEGKIDAVVTPRSQDADFGRYQDVRKEIQSLPSYKNFSQAAPIYDTMVDAVGRDTKASDLNLVYGLGKIFDPGSVVREGEMVMVSNTASLPDWFIGTINSVNGGARLTPETRKAILREARSRLNAYKGILDSDMGQYRDLAQHFKLDENYLIPPVPAIRDLPDDQTGQGGLPVFSPSQAAPQPVAPPAPQIAPLGQSVPAQDGAIDWRDWIAPGRKR